MKIFEYVITGGPCSGKTTCLSMLDQFLSERGFKVIVVPETATEVISSGISPTDMKNDDFQSLILDRSLNKEETTREAVLKMGKDTVILYDRGILDSKAYMTQQQFSDLLLKRGLKEVDLRDRYDAVFHLVTAAEGAEAFYTKENNKARSETPEQARALDHKTRQSWVGHPHLRVIDNTGTFQEKIKNLCLEITSAMGLPVPIEIERKYLVNMPDAKELNAAGAVKINILQTYLHSDDPKVERRVRQRGDGQHFTYYYTEKVNHSSLGRVESERRISSKEYLSLLLDAKSFIKKDRYCFVYKSQYFELDVYPAWKDKAILEIELTKETQLPQLPKWINVIEDVTVNKDFRNAELAKKFSEKGRS